MRFLLVLLLVSQGLFSCNYESGQKVENQQIFYANGNLREERTFTDDSTQLVKKYYESGELMSRGDEKNGIRNGYWLEQYIDGAIRWKGQYVNDSVLYDTNRLGVCDCKILSRNKSNLLVAGIRNPVRLKINGIHPRDICSAIVQNGTIDISDSLEMFDMDFTPKIEGEMSVKLYVIMNRGGAKGDTLSVCERILKVVGK